MTRRGLIVAAAIAVAASLTACGDRGVSTTAPDDAVAHGHAPVERTSGSKMTPADQPPVERKSASKMTPAEIDRFQRAYSYAVAKGYFDAFNDSHLDHHRNRNHGFELLATAPPTAMIGDTPAWGHRLLPWHRAFILEAEQMLRAALRERNRQEGRDPREADGLFIPYWDMTHDQTLPAWVQAFQPQGGTARVPPDLPERHPQYGKPVGSRYNIEFGRWPGNNIPYHRLPEPAQVAAILAHDDFDGFYRGVEIDTTINESALPAAQKGFETLQRTFPDNPSLQTIAETVLQGPPQPQEVRTALTQDREGALKVINAALGVGYLGTVQITRPQPDREVLTAVKDVHAAATLAPHVLLHLWAGGVDPANPEVRGTVTYFNELTVDPVFWMIHTELDRWWYTWEQSHPGLPELTGEDTEFQPVLPEQGDWYGGGRIYTLHDLAPPQRLPYRYAELFKS